MWVVNLDIPYFRLLLFAAFLLEHNLDEKNMRNIDVRIHVKLEMKVPIFWTHPPHPPHTHPKLPTHKFLTHATHVKNILTHVTHATHVKI